jgi:hypothetical protein
VPDESRPNPDALLAALQRAESQKRCGKLKVFLGMCAGVGKTYAMLEAARREAAAGREVVIGYLESHGRKETDALAEGLPAIPRNLVQYRGIQLSEFDLDAALARRPELILVDEFAHSNAPESRHPKRYQDILELLNAGMDVFTTLNIQHIESRTEAVSQIVGVRIQETVPDTALTDAEFELVDLPPDELRAPGGGKSLSGRPRGHGPGQFLSAGESLRAARTCVTFYGGTCRPGCFGGTPGAWNRSSLEIRSAAIGGRECEPDFGVTGALDAPLGGGTSCVVGGGLCRANQSDVERGSGAAGAASRPGAGTGRGNHYHYG